MFDQDMLIERFTEVINCQWNGGILESCLILCRQLYGYIYNSIPKIPIESSGSLAIEKKL